MLEYKVGILNRSVDYYFGLCNGPREKPNPEWSIFRSCSVTKQFAKEKSIFVKSTVYVVYEDDVPICMYLDGREFIPS